MANYDGVDFSFMSSADLIIMKSECKEKTPEDDKAFIEAIDLELSKRSKS